MFSFADNTKLLSTTPAGKESSLPDDATTLFVWSEKNGLPFNVGKCKLLGFQKPNRPRFTLGDHELSLASSLRDLGVFVSDSLSWKLHVSAKCNKANKCFFLIKRNSAHSIRLPSVSTCTNHLLFRYSLILQLLGTHRNVTWLLSSVFRAEAQRPILCRQTTRLNILPVCLHLQIADVLLLSGIMSGKYDFNWHEFVKLHIHRTTRSSDRLLFELPSIRLEVQRNSF